VSETGPIARERETLAGKVDEGGKNRSPDLKGKAGIHRTTRGNFRGKLRPARNTQRNNNRAPNSRPLGGYRLFLVKKTGFSGGGSKGV